MERPEMLFALCVCASFFAGTAAVPSPGPRNFVPTATLDNGTFTGYTDVLTGTNVYLGIPFAQPP